jgi:FecR-like protein
MAKSKPPRDDLIDWFTISYKSIYIVVGVLAAAVAGAGYYYWTKNAPPKVATSDPGPAATTAHFTSIEGNVKVKPVGTFEWVSADSSTLLKKSDLVRTTAGASAEITFFDGTTVHVRPDSLITIEETSEDPSTKRRKVAWHISSGEVNFQTVRKNVEGSSTEVSTPTVKATAGEMAAGGIKVAEAGDTDVKLYRGTAVAETRAGQRVDLAANEGVTVDPGGKAGPKVALPIVPTLLAPPHQAEISYPDLARATTLLAWKPVPGAASYHVVVDYSPYFNRPLVDRTGWRETSMELRGLDVGKYYWHVSALDRDSVEGQPSDFARFTVGRPTGAGKGEGPPPMLIVEPLDPRDNIVQVKGRTEPGATVTVNGQRVDVASDGVFNEFISLEKVGRQTVVIRATGINGGVREERRPVVVAF